VDDVIIIVGVSAKKHSNRTSRKHPQCCDQHESPLHAIGLTPDHSPSFFWLLSLSCGVSQGPFPRPGEECADLINAGKETVKNFLFIPWPTK